MTRRAFITLFIFALIGGGVVLVESLRTPADGRVRVEIFAPGITITAPDRSTHVDGLILDFAPWLDVGVETPPVLGHLADQGTASEIFLPHLLPAFREVGGYGPISAETGRDRRYFFEFSPMTVENGAGQQREIVLLSARGINTASRACFLELEDPGEGYRIERRGTELRAPSWFDRWTGSPDRVIVVEFGVVESGGAERK